MNGQTQSCKMLSFRLMRSLLVPGIGLASTVGLLGLSLLQALPSQTQTLDGSESAAPLESAPAEAAPTAPEPAAPYVEPAAPAEPAFPPVPEVPAAMEAQPSAAPRNEAYIDSTDYAIGATQRTRDIPTSANARFTSEAAPSMPSSVQIGPVSVSYGLGVGTTPSVKDFYQRTLRPPGRLGNGNIRLIFPLSVPAPITSLFGWRVHPIFDAPRFHTGTDLGAPLGTPVVAAYAGQVAIADFLGGYGLAIALDHNKGKQQTLYGHLSEVFVKPGEWVNQGAVIGRVGSTGNSTGPHLHFEYRELTADGWVALDAGANLEYALAELVKVLEVSEKGIANAQGLQVSQKSLAGISGKIELPERLAQQPDQ